MSTISSRQSKRDQEVKAATSFCCLSATRAVCAFAKQESQPGILAPLQTGWTLVPFPLKLLPYPLPHHTYTYTDNTHAPPHTHTHAVAPMTTSTPNTKFQLNNSKWPSPRKRDSPQHHPWPWPWPGPVLPQGRGDPDLLLPRGALNVVRRQS